MSDHRFAWLLDRGLLVCPSCEATEAWTATEAALRCGACGQATPVIAGVPDFFTGYAGTAADTATTEVASSVIGEIRETLQLPNTDDVRSSISSALALAERDTDRAALTAEIREVHARFVGGEVEQPPPPDQANGSPRAEIERHYTPDALLAGERRFVNVRLRNTGDETWSSRTSPVAITAASCFHRRSRSLRDLGRRITTEPVYTTLPIDIEPGRAITLPIEVVAPETTGRWQLELGLFRHPVGFVDGATLDLDVDVVDTATPATRPVPAIVETLPAIGDYGRDHEVANHMVEAALDRRASEGRRQLIEIGGSTHPQSWNHQNADLVNVDISAPTLALGALYDRHHGRSIAHLCADAMALPLTPGEWHAVIMYATLHHFPAPEELLQAAARLIRPDGIVAVMCEPTDHTLAHPGAIRDLLGGINEQTFAIDEYLWMAERAGLALVEAVDHAGSFKAVFERA